MGMVVEGKSKLVTIAPVIVPAAYADGDQIGVAIQVPNILDDSSGTGALLSLTVIDKSKQKSALDLLLFSQKPTLISADNAPLDISDADMAAYFIGRVRIESTDYVDLANSSVACVRNIGVLLTAVKDQNNPEGRSLWAVVQSRGAPTYASASDLTLKLGAIQD